MIYCIVCNEEGDICKCIRDRIPKPNEIDIADIKIAPCPCCGDSEVVTHLFGWKGTEQAGIAIECESCGCGMSGEKYKTKEQIIEAWNQRK